MVIMRQQRVIIREYDYYFTDNKEFQKRRKMEHDVVGE